MNLFFELEGPLRCFLGPPPSDPVMSDVIVLKVWIQ